ncbi:LytR C-terminal domain-containing protein [Yinghuangia soli]|uniref:LytR C-terminal domain-containing protein n=1 Tax=Yinghuangia soli TaxID=2908204 RepID=A0AA41Q7A9_9ACTN|nr:LytR C-terminal domain-containing protein [Yinghuangia soli]MCF2532908.1 LytR C-terminal domain-containing protein [Yinghuangia soli]
MSMLTPRGMRGQYKITGKLYPRMTRRRRKWPIVVACLVALAVLSTGAWAVYHFTADDKNTTASKNCKPQPSGSPGAPNTQPVSQTGAPANLPAPATITVNVYNGTDRAGLAKAVADELKKRGFVIGKVANDPLRQANAPVMEAAVQFRAGVPGKTPSTVVAAHVAGTPAPPVEDTRTDATVDLVLGAGFQALATPEAAAAALAPPPPPSQAPLPAGC